MENQTQQAQSQPEQKKKWYIKRWWIVVFVIIIFWVIIGTSLESAKEKAQEAEKQEQTAVTNQSIQNQEAKVEASTEFSEKENIEPKEKAENLELAQDTPEKNTKGEQAEEENKEINITRNEIINLFPEFNFIKGTAVDGEENYVGKSKEDAIFQIIGAGDDISEIALTTAMSFKSVENMEKQDEYFSRLIDKLMPGTKSYELIGLTDTGDKIEKNGYEIAYTYVELDRGTYIVTHSFRKL